MNLKKLIWVAITVISLFLTGVLLYSAVTAGSLKEPDHKLFQDLLTRHPGWHGIQWNSFNPGSECHVNVNHEVDGLTYRFSVSRIRNMGTEVSVFHPSFSLIWKRASGDERGKFYNDQHPEILAQEKIINRLAEELLDAFSQGEDK